MVVGMRVDDCEPSHRRTYGQTTSKASTGVSRYGFDMLQSAGWSEPVDKIRRVSDGLPVAWSACCCRTTMRAAVASALELLPHLARDGLTPFAAACAGQLLSRGLQPHHSVLDVGCGIGRWRSAFFAD